jgi:hypothetical protein
VRELIRNGHGSAAGIQADRKRSAPTRRDGPSASIPRPGRDQPDDQVPAWAAGAGTPRRLVAWWAVVSASLAPALLIGGWLIAGALQPASYSPVRQTLSVLASDAGTDRWIMTTAFLLVGGCHLVTAAGPRCVRIRARVLLAAAGMASIGIAACPEPARGSSPVHLTWTVLGAPPANPPEPAPSTACPATGPDGGRALALDPKPAGAMLSSGRPVARLEPVSLPHQVQRACTGVRGVAHSRRPRQQVHRILVDAQSGRRWPLKRRGSPGPTRDQSPCPAPHPWRYT